MLTFQIEKAIIIALYRLFFLSPILFANNLISAEYTENANRSEASFIDIDPQCIAMNCGIQDAGLSNIACFNGNTLDDDGDDQLVFLVNPTGNNLGTNGFIIEVDQGFIVGANSGNYGGNSSFTLQPGSAGGGDISLTIRDVDNPTCSFSFTLADPGSCSPLAPMDCFEESFENIGALNSSFGLVSWTGDEGVDFFATNARTDSNLNSRAITLTNGSLVATDLSTGIASLTLTTQNQSNGSSGQLTVLVNGAVVGFIPYDSSIQTTTISNFDVEGFFDIQIDFPAGDEVAIDNLSWACPEPFVCDNPFPIVDQTTMSTQILSGQVAFSWQPIVGQIGCQIEVARFNPFQSRTFNILGNDADSFVLNSNPIAPGVLHGWRVRCGCSESPLVAGSYTAYLSFMIPPEAIIFSGPNPTNGLSKVQFALGEESYTTLEVFDLNGNLVESLYQGITSPDKSHTINYDASRLVDGIYLYRLTTEREVIHDKFILKK